MQTATDERRGFSNTVWALILIGTAAIVFALCAGAAYAGVRRASLTSARASVGQIEAVMRLAEAAAREGGLGEAPAKFNNLLKSYDEAGSATLPAYEKYILDAMVDAFGPNRDFDFAVTRYEDGAGVHTQVYYFPHRGKTDTRTDRHYLMTDGTLVEKNG